MLHIFADPSGMEGEYLRVEGSEYNHMANVLRMKKGEEVSVSGGEDGARYLYEIDAFGPDTVILKKKGLLSEESELPVRVILFQGLPKSDKMEWIIQKSVELGVTDIVPVSMKRCVMKLDPRKEGKKLSRWQAIAESAAMQSKRARIPVVHPPMTMKEAVKMAEAETDLRVLPYELQEGSEGTKELFSSLERGQCVSVFIGPEGGFEPSEVEEAASSGIRPISLGRRILRTETAAMVVLSWLIYRFEIA